ncbi:hypothetical protein [Lysobacter gummosus]|uniref:hypothetical protein n=1 Tax=Lysobacter gummosus TaxID=262324 RepID=UPI0036346E02
MHRTCVRWFFSDAGRITPPALGKDQNFVIGFVCAIAESACRRIQPARRRRDHFAHGHQPRPVCA